MFVSLPVEDSVVTAPTVASTTGTAAKADRSIGLRSKRILLRNVQQLLGIAESPTELHASAQ